MGAMRARSLDKKRLKVVVGGCGGCGLTGGPNLIACGVIMVMVMGGEYVA